MPFSHIVYIDEAGDEGFGKLKKPNKHGQSCWLVLGAAVVRSNIDITLPEWRKNVLRKLGKTEKHDLHFRLLKHEQKVAMCHELAALNISSCVTLSNKAILPGSQWADTFKRPGYLYNYMTRWLLERVTAFCAGDAHTNSAGQRRIKVVFSRRRGTDYQVMSRYMSLMKQGKEAKRPVRSINWSVFDPCDIAVENHSKWAGLQISDAITSAYFSAVEPNFYGYVEPSYANLISGLAVRVNGNALNAGVAPVPGVGRCGETKEQLAFLLSFKK